MSLTRYLITMTLATLVSAASWVLVLFTLDPLKSGILGMSLFFGSFFLMMFGAASTIGFLLRHLFQGHEPSFRLVAISFRQAGLLAILVTAALFLQSHRLFTWWTAGFLVLTLSLVEAFFVARQSARQSGGPYGA